MVRSQLKRGMLVASAMALVGLVGAIAPLGAGAQSMDPKAGEQGVDDGTTITMWSRAATETLQALVDAYNASHQNQVGLRLVPDRRLPRRGRHCRRLLRPPDLFSADVVFMPNWTSQGLFADVTDRFDALPYQGHRGPGAVDGVDLGGQDLRPAVRRRPVGVDVQQGPVHARPGSIPSQPPTTLAEFDTDARRRQARW